MTLDAHTRAFLEKANVNPQPAPGELPLETFRAAAAALRPLGFEREEVAEVVDVEVPVPAAAPARVRLYRPDAAGPLPLVVCVHGGSWVRMTVPLMDAYYRVLANRSGCLLAAVDYRLAPESRFPAALEEVHAAACWAQASAGELGCDADRVAIYGESSGGNVAAAAALLARDRGAPAYARQVLLLPVLDARLRSPSWDALGSGYLLTRDQLEWALEQYAPGVPRSHPLLSPLCAEHLAGLPPALIVTGEYDPLRDDGERYAAALERAGVEVRHRRVAGLIHHALMVPKAIPLSARVIEDLGAQLGAAPAPSRA